VQRSLADLRGRPVLVTFAFGHCETLCPLVVGQVLAAQASLAGSAASPAVLIVTVDPWRDVPSRLPSMAAAWHLPARDAWVLGGDVATVEATLDAWRVPRDRDLRTGDVTHPALVYVIDAAGRIAFATTGGTAILRGVVDRL
jgi:cytochrome oxidase Cu insertion factor (SCO1/SenC/PrrC family)